MARYLKELVCSSAPVSILLRILDPLVVDVLVQPPLMPGVHQHIGYRFPPSASSTPFISPPSPPSLHSSPFRSIQLPLTHIPALLSSFNPVSPTPSFIPSVAIRCGSLGAGESLPSAARAAALAHALLLPRLIRPDLFGKKPEGPIVGPAPSPPPPSLCGRPRCRPPASPERGSSQTTGGPCVCSPEGAAGSKRGHLPDGWQDQGQDGCRQTPDSCSHQPFHFARC